MKRYQALADDIAHSIRDGVFKPGDRLPSVRQASEGRHVSPSTVFQAYYLLEARGLIRARAKSGYYVTGSATRLPPEVEMSERAPGSAAMLDVSDLVFEVLESSMQHDVVPFGSAFPSPLLFPMQRLARTMATSVRKHDPRHVFDDLTPGNPDLRRQIALRYLVDGLQVAPEDIIITNGALEALNLCLQAVTRPGDAVVIESPCFYAALQSIERNGLRAIEVPTHPREGIELSMLERVLKTQRPKACWLMSNFQNPLGSLMPHDKKQALVRLLAEHQVPLIEDDVYGELYFGATRPTLAKSFDTEGLVMHCSSFSKCLAPGYRVGWVAPGRFLREIARQKLTLSLTTSAPAQITLAAYLERGGYDRHLRQLRETLAAQRDAYIQAIVEHFPAGTRATRPEGGYFLWIELPGQVDTLALHRDALAAGVSIAPGPIFSASRDHRHCLRFNYGHPLDARARAGLATLGGLIAARLRVGVG